MRNQTDDRKSPRADVSPGLYAKKRFHLMRRTDLEVVPQSRAGRQVWVIKDPISLRYFELSQTEHFIFSMLDGNHSLDAIEEAFEERYVNQRLPADLIQSFAARLHSHGLMIAKSSDQGDRLWDRNQAEKRRRWISALANPLAIRLPGVNLSWLLDRLYPRVAWIFNWTTLWLIGFLAIMAIAAVFSRFDVALAMIPQLDAFLSPRNLVILGIVLAATKFLHELAHALTCQHFGGKCHEMGVLFLVFTPCLYCDVTDSWRLKNRWQRIAISSAGMISEIALASICALFWMIAEPGLMRLVLFNVVVVCSIGTLLINGNPLLRYDGYFILSDLTDQPNLWQQSRRMLGSLWSWCLTGQSQLNRQQSAFGSKPRQLALVAYGIASIGYRATVLVSIILLIGRALIPNGYWIAAYALLLIVGIGDTIQPITSIWNLARNPMYRRRLRPKRIATVAILAASILGSAFVIPVPYRIRGIAIVEPEDARQVFVSVPGILRQATSEGKIVKAGEPLALLENMALEREIESMRSQIESQRLQLQNLNAIRNESPAAAAQIPMATQILADLNDQYDQMQRDRDALQLRSPTDGVVIAPNRIVNQPSGELELVSWQGRPFDDGNVGAYLPRQTLYCLVGETDTFQATVYVDQSDVSLVHVGQSASLVFECSRNQVIDGTVTEVSEINADQVPEELSVDNWIATRPMASGPAIPLQPTYRVAVELPNEVTPLVLGSRGHAKIHVSPQTISTQLMRAAQKTFSVLR